MTQFSLGVEVGAVSGWFFRTVIISILLVGLKKASVPTIYWLAKAVGQTEVQEYIRHHYWNNK